MILVTGASGYIGGYLVKRLVADGTPVRVLLRAPSADLPPEADCRVLGDLGSANLADAMGGIGAVVHLAGRAHVFHERNADPQEAYRAANTELTLALARAAAGAGVSRFVFMSTIKVFGDAAAGPLRETDTPVPDDAYGRSKLEAEQGLMEIVRTQARMTAAIIRSPLVYGPQCTGNVRRLCGLLSRGIPLPFGAVHNRRSMISVENLSDILVRAATDERAANQTYVVSDGPPISTPQMIRSLSEGLALRPRLFGVPPRLLGVVGAAAGFGAEIKRLCGSLEVDPAKLQEQLGWRPLQSTHEGLVDAGASFRRAG